MPIVLDKIHIGENYHLILNAVDQGLSIIRQAGLSVDDVIALLD